MAIEDSRRMDSIVFPLSKVIYEKDKIVKY
jgi:hypothetical protein